MNMHIEDRMFGAQASFAAALLVLSVTPALAYVDPGTGSMLLQMGLAAIAGAMFYFRQFRMVAAGWFRRTVLRQKPDVRATDGSSSTPDLAD